MNYPKEKFRLLYFPFLLTFLAMVVGYSLLHWLLVIKTTTIVVRDDVADFWVPFVLTWVPVLGWLRPRVNLLLLTNKRGKSTNFLYLIAAVLAIAVPLIIAQLYLETATGKLTTLNTISEINKHPATKYYAVAHHFVAKNRSTISATSDVVNSRNDHHIYLGIYVACPIYETKEAAQMVNAPLAVDTRLPPSITNKSLFILDGLLIERADLNAVSPDSIATITVLKGDEATALYGDAGANGVLMIQTKRAAALSGIKLQPAAVFSGAWLCINYQKKISSRISAEERNAESEAFYKESEQNFKDTNLESFVYLQRAGNDDKRKAYATAIKKVSAAKSAAPVILEPVLTPFSERNGNKLVWIFGSFAIGAVVWLLIIGVPYFDEDKLAAFLNGTLQKEKIDQEVLRFFVPKPGFYLTPIILYANILVFIVMVCSGLGFVSFSGENLLKWGANYGPYTINGEWWRLLTNLFLHGGVMHLLGNMYGLLFVGVFLEPKLSKMQFGLLYITTGVLASITSLWWHTATISVGASGAIFGLYGAFLALLLSKVFPQELNKAFLVNTVIFIAYNLAMGLAGGIDNAAHIGGLLSGFFIGFILAASIKSKEVS